MQVNDTSIEGLCHAEVVALIRAGGTDTRLLVVDPDTDELFSRLGIVPTSIHLKGTVRVFAWTSILIEFSYLCPGSSGEVHRRKPNGKDDI